MTKITACKYIASISLHESEDTWQYRFKCVTEAWLHRHSFSQNAFGEVLYSQFIDNCTFLVPLYLFSADNRHRFLDVWFAFERPIQLLVNLTSDNQTNKTVVKSENAICYMKKINRF